MLDSFVEVNSPGLLPKNSDKAAWENAVRKMDEFLQAGMLSLEECLEALERPELLSQVGVLLQRQTEIALILMKMAASPKKSYRQSYQSAVAEKDNYFIKLFQNLEADQ